MAYIPPHIRQKSTGGAQPELPTEAPVRQNPNLTLAEINNHFWPGIHDEDYDGPHPPNDGGKGRTLHESAETPGELACVILSWEANPCWETESIIFTKSSLDLLPRENAEHPRHEAIAGPQQRRDSASVDAKGEAQAHCSPKTDDDPGAPSQTRRAIAVFKQDSGKRLTRGYKFDGWYNISKVSFLEPYSEELIRMLEQKWTKKDRYGRVRVEERRGADWNKSLSYRWAVVKLDRDEDADREKGELKIERLPGDMPKSPGKPRKSVNEMLAEMRLKDGQPKAVNSEATINDTANATEA
jgi:hypothetical protein